MRRKGIIVLIYIVLLLMPTACWNSKDLQSMAYATAIGLDYVDGKFITYIQVLNFSNIAKGEMSSEGKNVPTWIGRGEGVTVTESLNSIYSTAQLRIFWGHVKAIVMSERFMKQGARVAEAYDMINRYREIRYNILLFGTKEPMRNVFSQKSNLYMSPIESILENPLEQYSQRSYILPMYGYKFIAKLNEPTGIAILPSLSINSSAWTEDQKKRTMFWIDGAYIFCDNKFCGWFSNEKLAGYRWMEKKLERSLINVPNSPHPDVALVMIKPKPSVQYTIRNGKAHFTIKLSIQAYVDEMIYNRSRKDIEEQAAQDIEKQIRATYENGLGIHADVLGLTESLYRKNPKMWQKLQESNKFILDHDSLERIDVAVKLQHSGKYKLRVK
ncbi:Ger(x)C family spore germination protein [Gorillibacterium massiliense]|uniref:Ger(x)C family spore germination protein n=1 Tax=Gorillibacterium massiliense TaxID=1280390 RepID=UPI0004B9C636|nr:Ger(x)C family spore germination protein [Gorillibacterium massiliense]